MNAHAIEISSSAVKLLGMTRRKKSDYAVTHASRHPYDSKATLADTVHKALAAAGAENSFFGTSIWAPTMVLRKISLPRLKPGEIAGALQLEADKYVPFGLDECVMDHYLFPQDPQGAKTEVMLVASKKDLILDRCRLLEESSLKMLFMEIHPLSLTNWLMLRKPEMGKGVHAFLHIGDAPGRAQGEDNFVVVLKDGVPWVIRDLGDRLAAPDTGEEAFSQTAALAANAIVFAENLLHERPKEILLSADDAVAGKLGEAVEKASRIRPVRWQPADGLEFADDAAKQAFAAFPSSFASALGVAARVLAS